jgi:hypothetical protein
MTNPTTPFGWQMPTSTDLVTDLPADFETFGQAVATSMADLLGGTTGQILAKASNTNMDFTWTTPNPGDITAVTAGTGITGGGTSGDVTVSFDQANFGGGQFAAGKNKIINGNFAIAQRGTTFSNPNGDTYTLDRFRIFYNGTGATRTVSQQTFTPGAAPVAGYESASFFRYATTVAGTGNTGNIVGTRVEDVRTLAGQTATFSFWIKSSNLTAITSLEINQNFGSGGSASVGQLVTLSTTTISSSWTRITGTLSMASLTGKTIGTSSYLDIVLTWGGGVGTIDTWGWQLEAGSVATPFQTASGGSPQAELAMCQRYYYSTGTGLGNPLAMAAGFSLTQAFGVFRFPVTMRTAPTLVQVTGTNYYNLLGNGTSDAFDSFAAITDSNVNGCRLDVTSGIAAVPGYSYWFTFNNAAANVAFSAEL